jgi:hypothetical protein
VSRAIVALTVVGVVVGAAVQVGMVFLTIAPSNTISLQHAAAISDYISPEFDQNWKLFAPNPLQENDDVQTRAEILMPNGTWSITGWVDLTAPDEAKIVHNPLPSHTQQNELRLAWGYFVQTHDNQGRPIGLRGYLSQEYLRRVVAHRFGPLRNGGTVQLIQVRTANTPVAAAPWSSQQINTSTYYQLQPWWIVNPEDFK